MSDKMLIDASHAEETRVVVVRGNRIEEFDFESQHKKQLRGNIYLAKVTRVEPSLQAAFVDYGGNRHGFLAFSEIHPDYYQIPLADRQALLAAEAEAEAERARVENEEDDAEDASESESGGASEPEEGGVTEIIDEDDDADSRPQKAKGRGRARRGRKADGRGRKGDEDSDGGVDEIAAAVDADEISEPVDGRNDNDDDRDPGEIDHDAALHVEGKGDVLAPETLPASEPRRDPVEEPVVALDAPAEHQNDDAEDAHEGGDLNADEAAKQTKPRARKRNSEDTEEAVAKVDSVGAEDALEELPDRSAPRKPRKQYRIQEVIKRRQIMLVQVVKEERGNKGAALTTYLSLAGRYSVLMPNTARGGGISRKITNVADRKRLKEVARGLDVPQGMGVILRTAGANRTKAEVKRDFEYLMRLWENVRNLTLASTAPCLVYEEGSLIKRSIRDLYNRDISEIIVSGEEGYREAKDFMRMLMPSHAKVVQPYRDIHPIFSRSGIEAQLDRMLQPQVTLKSGGYIIINQTEALVAIDVNSGRSTKEHSIEDTALQTNLEAADEVARQLRLRDLAGLIVVDFIDMEEKRNNRSVEKRLKDALKNDRARIQVGRISHFGLLEMSRQRIRASVLESTTQVCEHCGGTGHVRSQSSVALHVLRSIEEFLLKSTTHNITVRTTPQTALYLLNQKRETIIEMERRFGVSITIEGDTTIGASHLAIDRGTAVETPVKIENIAAEFVYPEDEDDDVPVSFDEDDVEEAPAEAAEAGDRPSQRNQRQGEDSEGGSRGKRRRRRRGRRDRDGDASGQRSAENGADAAADAGNDDEDGDEDENEGATGVAGSAEAGEDDRPKKRRRRGKRGGRRNRNGDEDQQAAGSSGEETDSGEASGEDDDGSSRPVVEPEMTGGESDLVENSTDDEAAVEEAVASLSDEAGTAEPASVEEVPAEKPKKRRAPRRKKADIAAEEAAEAAVSETPAVSAEEVPAQPEPAAVAAPAAEPEPAPEVAAATEAPETPAEASPPAPPVVSSNGTEAVDKPKKGGWWQRRGFF